MQGYYVTVSQKAIITGLPITPKLLNVKHSPTLEGLWAKEVGKFCFVFCMYVLGYNPLNLIIEPYESS